ncbi:MAG: intradiol ring-cleavage dioxygenase [Burkholderiaceae bacterium]
MKQHRRRFGLLGGLSVALLAFSHWPRRVWAARSLQPTPPEPEGPYYPPHTVWPAQVGANLRGGEGGAARAAGRALDLRGSVVDTEGRALVGAEVEIWQTDGYGHYLHPDGLQSGVQQGRDPAFAGIGRAETDAGGEFSLRTIVPVAYSSRPPHIHVKVYVGGHERLTTQLYFPGQLEERGLASRLFGDRTWGTDRSRLSIALEPASAGVEQGRFRFVL